MCSTCRRYLAEIASAEQRGDTRTAEVKRKLYEAYRRNVCGGRRLPCGSSAIRRLSAWHNGGRGPG